MTAVFVLDDNARMTNVRFELADTDTEAVRVTGDKARVTRVSTIVGTAWTSGFINVSGDDCTISDIHGSGARLAQVNVTGNRARISNVNSASGGFGCAVRLSGSTGSVVENVQSNGDENGLIVLNSPFTQAHNIYVTASDAVGIIWDGSNNGTLDCVIEQAGQHGLRVDDSDGNRFSGVVVDASKDTTNTYDGVFVEGDSDQNRFGMTVRYGGSGNQMRYGLNISASTCNTNVEASLLIGSGATGAYNDSGTDTRTTDDHIVS